MKHRAVTSAIYRLPFGRGRDVREGHRTDLCEALAGNWNITSIATFSTGVPFDVTAPEHNGIQQHHSPGEQGMRRPKR